MLEVLKEAMRRENSSMMDIVTENVSMMNVRDTVLQSISHPDPSIGEAIVDEDIDDPELEKILRKIPETDIDSDTVSDKEIDKVLECLIPESVM